MGRVWRSVNLGVKSLLLHKLRSSLTILGVVFGVAAVIMMLAVGEGAARDAQEQIAQLGATNIIYRSVKPSQDAQSQKSGGRPSRVLNYGLKYEDFDRILATVPTITKALPIREIKREVRRSNQSMEARVVGTTHDYQEFNRLQIERGRFLLPSDNEHYENYCVLAAETARTLFPFENPLRQSIKIGSDYYTVVGVTKPRGSTAAIGGSMAAQEYDKDVYIPLNTCRARFGERILSSRAGSQEAEETQLSQITLQVKEIDEVPMTAPVIEAAVQPFHEEKKDVDMVVPYELLEQAKRQAAIFSLVLGSIAAISLIVGGIGIMNIMLATVTERTREIGIRRALGAKRRDITQQFLIETVVLSGIGGLIGVAIGVFVPPLITQFSEIKAVVTPSSVMLSFGVSVLVGIVAGLYPANRAAKMDPIEALRHE
ncbi:ABC transporter permease [Tautonia marina]|uniref:ABC transporter permease n=1 Tax=Tautonia marina TaxID=2653855 RepID=UPI001260F180|nr:ABC transporter permease [Tautonia marina]